MSNDGRAVRRLEEKILGGIRIADAAGGTSVLDRVGSVMKVSDDGGATFSPLGGSLDSLMGTIATIASAATTDLTTATGQYSVVSGTATITALGSEPAGICRVVQFSGAAVLTHNASSLILPGAANIQCAAGDVAVFFSMSPGNWRCISYLQAAVAPGAGLFATTTTLQLANVNSALINALRLTASLTTLTAGGEYGQWLWEVVQNGALLKVGGIGTNVNLPCVFVGDPAVGYGLRKAATQLQFIVGAFAHFACDSANGVQLNVRLHELKGPDIASGSTLTLGTGNYFHVTGTTAVNYIVNLNWVDGARVDLYCVSALTFNHNTGSVPASTFALDLAGGVNASLTAGSRIGFRYDIALAKFVEVSRVVR